MPSWHGQVQLCRSLYLYLVVVTEYVNTFDRWLLSIQTTDSEPKVGTECQMCRFEMSPILNTQNKWVVFPNYWEGVVVLTSQKCPPLKFVTTRLSSPKTLRDWRWNLHEHVLLKAMKPLQPILIRQSKHTIKCRINNCILDTHLLNFIAQQLPHCPTGASIVGQWHNLTAEPSLMEQSPCP